MKNLYFDQDGISRIESYQVERMDDNWVGVGVYNAYSSDIYTIEVTTLIDSSSTSNGLTEFRVIANMEEGNYVSESSFGFSIDNIVPSTPNNFSSSYENENIILNWDHIDDDDFRYYSLLENGDLVVETIDNSYVYNPITEEIELNYIFNTDINGNTSIPIQTNVLNTDYSLADINQDYNYNILDIVLLIDFILSDGDLSFYPDNIPSNTYLSWSGDLNNDNLVNIIDIVLIVDIIMDIRSY